MKRSYSTIKALIGATALAVTSCAHSAPHDTDFNEVSKQAAIMLQNRHYNRIKFDEKLSEKIFDLYLETIDRNRVYLTAFDVARFEKKYKKTLHEEIVAGRSIDIAEEIYDTVKLRAKQRQAEVTEQLKQNGFTFDSLRKMARDRSEIAWVKDDAAATELWKKIVEANMLSEHLRRKNIARLAAEQGKPDPMAKKRPAIEAVKLDFKRQFSRISSTDREEIANHMISALAAAYCPHTDYFSAREMEEFMSSIRTQLVGVGALLQVEEDGATRISGIIIGGPTDKGGELKLNDRIIAVDTDNSGTYTDIMFMKLDKVVELIRGKDGSKVRLKVESAENHKIVKEIIITRASVELKNDKARAQLIEVKNGKDVKRLGVIHLPSFYANFQTGVPRCSVDLEKLIVRLKKEGVDGIMLDLRGNGGGSLEEVRRMTGFFVGHGPVVQVRNSKNRVNVLTSDRRPPIWTGPLVVAIDRTSASASEILAGALQDYNRAVIIGGDSTYGKGTVQQPFDLRPWLPAMSGRERAGYLKPTIQKFYRVAGSSTQLKGVESDIVLPSVFDGSKVGERNMKYALKHDEIDAARGFKALDRSKLFISKLKAASAQRVNKSIDYAYIKKDVARIQDEIKENSLSLNIRVRQSRNKVSDIRIKQRNKERIQRFKELQKMDVQKYSIYRLELDDLQLNKLEKLDLTNIKDPYMRLAKNDLDDLIQTPNWPSEMDMDKREAINILVDLISLSKGSELQASK